MMLKLLKAGRSYRVIKPFSFLSDNFETGEKIIFLSSKYSPYDNGYGLDFQNEFGDKKTVLVSKNEINIFSESHLELID